VGESTLTKRALPEAFQAIRKGEWDPWQVVEAREGRVTSVRPVHPK
jgi:hypothetical protein